ncbi:MAG TPA: hypothetical protein VLJ42_08705 [Solirubrobacteraceae bacterium]|nr:hypothetical protein [Solirubrobacteraceae bacterium]
MKAVNLIPADQRGGSASAKGQSEGGAFVVLGVLAGLAIMALLYGMAHHQISSRRGEAATLSAQAQAAQAQAQALAPYTSFAALHQQRLQAISQLVDTRFDWAHTFHEIGRVLPYGVALTSVHGSIAADAAIAAPVAATPTPTSTGTSSTANTSTGSTAAAATPAPAASPVTSATPAGSTPIFTLSGCATSQSEVARALQRMRLIDGVSDVELQSSTKPTGSGGSGGSSSGSCPHGNPAFSVQITFSALPDSPSAGSSAAPAAAGATPAAATAPATGATAQPASATTPTATGGS